MPFQPKNHAEILRNLRGMVLGRTALNDISPGSALNTMLSAVAAEMASAERRLRTVRESFFMETARGADLDERAEELAPSGLTRVGRTNASGAVLYLERDATDTAEALRIPSGSSVVAKGGQRFYTTSDVIINAGDNNIDNVHIVAQAPGAGSNLGIGDIERPLNMPPEIILVTNNQPLTNGQDEETDEQFRLRIMHYLKSMNRSQRASIEVMARSFVGSAGDRFPFARLYEDPAQPGYCELAVDDGSGLTVEAISRPGTTISQVIPVGGGNQVFHEGPATQPIAPESIIIHVGGDPNTQIRATAINYTSIPERGVIYFKPGVIGPGDRVIVQNYRVFTGLISEIQQEIEGQPGRFDRLTGFRAAGTRVRVIPVTPEFVLIDMALLVDFDADYTVIEYRAKQQITNFISNLGPGDVLYISKLIDAVVAVKGVKDVKFYERDSTDRKDNVQPSSDRAVLRVRASSINITSTSQE